MPLGKRSASTTIVPSAARLTCQQSSMFTNWYPASFIPVLTTASVISRISLSLTSHPNLFQLFHPIGGVAAIFVDCALALCGDAATTSKPNVASKEKAAPACRQDFLAVLLFTIITPVLDAQIIQRAEQPTRVIPRAMFARGTCFFFVARRALHHRRCFS